VFVDSNVKTGRAEYPNNVTQCDNCFPSPQSAGSGYAGHTRYTGGFRLIGEYRKRRLCSRVVGAGPHRLALDVGLLEKNVGIGANGSSPIGVDSQVAYRASAARQPRRGESIQPRATPWVRGKSVLCYPLPNRHQPILISSSGGMV
jgi:hypothetical protein